MLMGVGMCFVGGGVITNLEESGGADKVINPSIIWCIRTHNLKVIHQFVDLPLILSISGVKEIH